MHLKYKIDFLQTYEVFKKLRKNPTNTIFVMKMLYEAQGPSLVSTYSKLLQTSFGGEIAYNLEEISSYFATLNDRPEGSVGQECYKLFPK